MTDVFSKMMLVVIALLLAVIVVSHHSGNAHTYKVVPVRGWGNDGLEKQLNEQASQGWQFVGIEKRRVNTFGDWEEGLVFRK